MSKPSEKAMQTATEFVGGYGEDNVLKLAALIEAHTAEALAEHQRVISKIEDMLLAIKHGEMIQYKEYGEIVESSVPWDIAERALSEIAKLRKE